MKWCGRRRRARRWGGRQSFVSHLIAAGVNIKRISEWAGHSSIAVTLDVYGHLLPGDRETVLEQLDAYHAAALDG